MGVLYKSTRNSDNVVTSSQAILMGLSVDGGLFVADHMPKLDVSLETLAGFDYKQTAYEVMKLFLSDYTEEELKACINRAYDAKFDIPQITQLHEADGDYYLELYHGATIAFKDMALSILPHLMTTAARKNHIFNEIVILTATSGDTGKAALAGFADVPGTRIIVFYPKHGVSPIQEKQMVTQTGENTCVIGIEGNFDDAQSGVKAIFSDSELRGRMNAAGLQFSSANSINIGRLVPQIVYYVYAYGQLVKSGEIECGDEINITVPTGNFGNILAAYYAKQMGLPVRKLICASNSNKVLVDFFRTGTYDRNRKFILTMSPSMDILISSNLERLIYSLCGCDSEKCAAFMDNLKTDGKYTISDEMKAGLSGFASGFADEEETLEEIRAVYDRSHYVIDTHTAVASRVYRKYRGETGDERKTVIASTASPFKFSRSVMKAIGTIPEGADDLALADSLSALAGIQLPRAIEEIRSAPVRHRMVIETCDMKNTVEKVLGL